METIASFSATEADTVWQLVHGFDKLEGPEQSLEVFYQIIEEDFHASEFKRLYKLMGRGPGPLPTYERRYLYTDHDPIWKLLAYCYIGEADATTRFRHILAVSQDKEFNRTLERILRDETGHVGKAFTLLKGMNVSNSEVMEELHRINSLRAKEHWVRVFKRVINSGIDLGLSAFYYLLGPWFFWVAKKRLDDHLYINDDIQLLQFEKVKC